MSRHIFYKIYTFVNNKFVILQVQFKLFLQNNYYTIQISVKVQTNISFNQKRQQQTIERKLVITFIYHKSSCTKTFNIELTVGLNNYL